MRTKSISFLSRWRDWYCRRFTTRQTRILVPLLVVFTVAAIIAGIMQANKPPQPSLKESLRDRFPPQIAMDVKLWIRQEHNPAMPLPDKDATYGMTSYFIWRATQDAANMFNLYLEATDERFHGIYPEILSLAERDTWEAKCLGDEQDDLQITDAYPKVLSCPASNVIWLPLTTLNKVRQPSYLNIPKDDGTLRSDYRPAFAGAAVGVFGLARHLAHTVQEQAKLPKLAPADEELFAACMMGAWAGISFELGPDDDAAAVVATYKLAGPRPFAHTPQELLEAYTKARFTGRPVQCFTAYWPGFTPPPSK